MSSTLSLGPVELTPMRREDLETVRAWRNSPEVSQYMYTSPEISAEDQVAWFERTETDPTCEYWVIRYEGEPMGVANLAAISKAHSRCDWAFYLASPNARGKGIGGRVEFLVLDYVFGSLKLNKLCCEVFVFNEPVVRMHEKHGFQVEGTRRQHIRRGDEFLDIVEMGLLADAWQELRGQIEKKFQ